MASLENSSLPAGVQIWINGERRSEENAVVSVLDRGFLYGDSVFETLRTYQGVPFALAEHLRRLRLSAARVFIELPASDAEFVQEVNQAVAESGYQECYVRLMVTRGIGALGLDPGHATSPMRVLIVAPLATPPASVYENGIKAISYRASRANDATEAAGAKIGNYLVAVLAHREASQKGAQEALIMNSNGGIVEGATSNLFWFKQGVLMTVPLSAGILAGITREFILKAAVRSGLVSGERIPNVNELVESEGVFISSSIREMIAVVQIDERKVGDGRVPHLVSSLHSAFRELVGAQAKDG